MGLKELSYLKTFKSLKR